jgi:purine nucleosidase
MACRLILDVDTGVDDAMAILFALNRPGIVLEAVTATFGNIDLANATRNSLQILELTGRSDVPVAAGAARSLMQPFQGHLNVHGANGLGDIDLPAPSRQPVQEHASDLIVRMARAHPGEITLCPVGPLTNTAIAFAKAPETAQLLREVVIMGSTIFEPGIQNVPSPMVDANFWNDPEAARLVLRSGARIKLVGMDVTMKALLTPDMMREIAGGTRAGAVMMDIAQFYLRFYQSAYPGIAGCGLHDPMAVAVAEDPSLVVTQPMQVDVELRGEFTRGQIVADRRLTAKSPNVDVCLTVDVARFTQRVVEALRTVGSA